MSDFIQLEQQFLAHDLERTNFSRILLLGQVHLSITTLANLSEDLEITMAQASSPFAEVGAFAAEVFVQGGAVFFLRGGGGFWIAGFEGGGAGLALMNVAEEVEVVVQEVCGAMLVYRLVAMAIGGPTKLRYISQPLHTRLLHLLNVLGRKAPLNVDLGLIPRLVRLLP